MSALLCITDFVKTSEYETEALEHLHERGHVPAEVARFDHLPIPCLELKKGDPIPEEAKQCRGLMAYHQLKLDDEFFSNFPNLEMCVRVGVGYDNVNLEDATKRGIAIANTPSYGTNEVADGCIALMLNITRKNVYLINRTRELKRFDTRAARGATRLAGRTLGIVGLGAIGMAVARRAQVFGLKVIFYDPYIPDGISKALSVTQYDDLEDLLQDSDIVTLHCPLTKDTRHLLSEERLRMMRRDAYLINVARGGVVDEQALVKVMQDGHLSGAALDVLESEPNVPEELLELDNVIITPHTAFYTEEAYKEMRTQAVTEVARVLLGFRPRNCVNRHLGIFEHPRWKDRKKALF
eukprot:TRINITY_DN1342_c0_g3_i2.p1 TRINITY_DN1342_c0_g3~~TRINITY_DN1342_c0_g3_i2.p1  ORF type:complete len:352 (+),score=56.93 TRINITY_DN1342_c0_g3_i2:63-1118(+)